MKLGSIIFLLIAVCTMCVASTDYELKFVALLFRHGDRNPDVSESYPNDPYLHDDFSPFGRGQLSAKGKQREYQLGQNLRTLYEDFLGDFYNPREIVARSTDLDRTKMSLQLVMAGLFPPKGSQVWNSTLNWQPIITSSVPKAEDSLLKPDSCLQYEEEFERFLQSVEYQRKIEKFRPLMNNLTVETGRNISTTLDLFRLFNGLTALEGLNCPLPDWSAGIYPDGLLRDAAQLELEIDFYNNNLKRLSGGMVLRNITDTMAAIVNGKLEQHIKMNIFSAHEANVAALLAVLSDYNSHVPKYSSCVMAELLQKDDKFYVKARYYLGIPQNVVDLVIPGCGTLCSFDDFMKSMKNFIPSDEEMRCEKK